jgi:hypothetical protein|tara:strand:+ start:4170 stop:4376 length:207 start_codon:yes stop_codon:yes gene_type:complete
MPAKYKPTEKRVDRATKRVSVINHYIHSLSNEAIFEELNKAKPKHKQKIRNVIQKRGLKIKMVPIGEK